MGSRIKESKLIVPEPTKLEQEMKAKYFFEDYRKLCAIHGMEFRLEPARLIIAPLKIDEAIKKQNELHKG